MKPLRTVAYLGLAIVCIVTAACTFAAWVLMTESGTAWIFARAGHRLPASIEIGRVGGTIWHGLELSNVAVSTDGALVDVDRAELELSLDNLLNRRLVIERLGVRAIRYEQREASAVASRGPIEFPIAIDVASGAIETLTVALSDAEQVLGPIEFVASLENDSVVIEQLAGTALGFTLRGAGTIRLAEDVALDSSFEWSTARAGIEYAGRGDAVGTWPTLRVHQDILAPAELVADGEITLGGAPNAELELSWTDVQWPWATDVRSVEGRLHVTGWLDAITFETTGNLTIVGIDADVVADGTATLSEIRFDRLDGSSSYGRFTSSGRLVIAPLDWSFDIRSQGIDPSARFAEWPGALDVIGRLSGRIQPELRVGLADATVSGSLRGRPVEAAGGIEFTAPDEWQFAAVTLDVAGNRGQLDGTVSDTLDLRIVADATDIAALIDAATGALSVDGMLTGSRQSPAFRGAVTGSGLAYGDYGAQSLGLDGEIVADEARTVELTLNAGGIRIGDRELETLIGRVTGTASDHVVEFDATAPYGNATLRARGDWSDDAWSGVVSELAVSEPTLGRWQLDAPTSVSATRTTLVVERACLTRDAASLCGSARAGTDDDALEVELRAFDLAVLGDVLPETVSMTGIFDADLALAGPLSRPAGRFSTRGSNSLITIREPEQPPLDIPIETLRADAELTPEGQLGIDAEFGSSTGGSVDVTATVTALWSDGPTVAGEIAGRWPDIAFLSLLSPDVGAVSGLGTIDLSFDGPLREPQVSGSAQWLEGRVEVPRFGLLVEDINATVASVDSTELSIDAKGNVGSGELSVTGTTRLDAAAGWPTELRVFGERLEAVRLPEAQIWMTPALAVEAALPDINVTGAFLIPEARLTLDEVPEQAAVPSPDAIVHDVEREVGPRPLNVRADIRVGLGDNVRYSGAGLDVALAGAMGVTYQSGEVATASGAVTLSGQYQAYGQTLEIDEGRLLFTGPIANPNLDVRATRKIDQTTVGIQLSGTVEAPVGRVFSEPAMAEADALSYLLLGRPLSTTGDEETATLESAAVAMGLQQALPVVQRVGESLGLDEFSVQTTTADAGELLAGKQLSPRVYIRYTYGLFNRVGGLLMRFNLSNQFSLETRTGDYRSMDLIYTVERD